VDPGGGVEGYLGKAKTSAGGIGQGKGTSDSNELILLQFSSLL
jgi:hypothetical protein